MRLLSILLLLLTLLGCQQPSKTTLYTNVTGYTMVGDQLSTFSALAFADGKVLETGDEVALRQKYADAQVLDGGGKVLLPGLIDAHGHVMGLGYKMLNVDLTGTNSLEEALDRVEAYAKKYPEAEWITGRGWNHTRWPSGSFPTAEDLDSRVADRPVWLRRVDGHAAWANTKAMEAADISAKTKDPSGGKLLRDDSGNPTGIFVDKAMALVESTIPEPSAAEQKLALEQSLERMRSLGLTSVHDAGIPESVYKLYEQFADEGKLTTRIYAMVGGAEEAFDALSSSGPISNYGDDMLWLRSVKLYSDGALGSRGAALIEDYSDDPGNRGLLFDDEEEMTRKIMKAASKGYQVNVHAIGDRGNRVVLNSFENVRNELGDSTLRHRIEHAQVVQLEDIPRFKELGLIASMQPTHATSDMNMAEDRVGPERIKGAYAWQRFLDEGITVAGGSDFPVESANPFYGLYSAVTRQDHQGEPSEGWYGDQAMSAEEAFRSFTIDAAYAGYMEELVGTLEPGKWADFILVDHDLFNDPVSELYQTEVMETWVGGEMVYQRSESGGAE